MSSPFVDEQNGEVTLGHITFRDGTLSVPKENIILQKLLSLYHPPPRAEKFITLRTDRRTDG